jgi:hypothetical protein
MGRKEDKPRRQDKQPNSTQAVPIWVEFIEPDQAGDNAEEKYPFEKSMTVFKGFVHQYEIVASEISADADLGVQYKIKTSPLPSFITTKEMARKGVAVYLTVAGTNEIDLFDRILSASAFVAGKRPPDWFARVVRSKIEQEKRRDTSS